MTTKLVVNNYKFFRNSRIAGEQPVVNGQNLLVYHIKSIDVDGRSVQPLKKK